MQRNLKYALVHDWLISIKGSEKVVKEINTLIKPDIITLFSQEEISRELFPDKSIHSSFLNKIPKIEKVYNLLLPLYPLAIENIDVSNYDVIISSSHAVAKGVLTNSEQLHICYCHTPMRYIWDLYFTYKNSLNKKLQKLFFSLVSHYLRIWDYSSANRVDKFIANSRYVANRIKKIYNREAEVIYPPVETNKFDIYGGSHDSYYITVGRLVYYKRVDVIVEAFNRVKDKKLLIIGDGPEKKKLKKMASRNIEFLGEVPFKDMKSLLQRAKAFIFAGIEDFGIAPVEAQACGIPVIGYAKGGLLETVIDGKTGIFFYEQTPESLLNAIKRFEAIEDTFNPREIKEWAENFSVSNFHKKFKSSLERELEKFFS